MGVEILFDRGSLQHIFYITKRNIYIVLKAVTDDCIVQHN